ncbi:GtrA family protein [Sphaerimonospora sp. CA-214678]|uniref:GtrA family protein n=1 Tax=Sphaerimonospora sp. CA-214678 TaxID=3240029 RepID=UPI003D8C860C
MLELKSPDHRKSTAARWDSLPALPRLLVSLLRGQRSTYLLAGAMTAGVYYALLCLELLVAGGAVPYLFLVVVGHLITVVIVYPVYRLVVFRSGGGWITGYLRFYVVGLSFLGASVIGLPVLVELAGIPLLIAQALIILLSPPLSYAINRSWTFRDRASESGKVCDVVR